MLAAVVAVKAEPPPLHEFGLSAEYRRRSTNQTLPELLKDFSSRKTIVLLGHRNDLHYTDGIDLVRAGFKVLVEKPYCLTATELASWQAVLLQRTTSVVFLEYYLMMKSVPLLLAFNLVKPASFYCAAPSLVKGQVGELTSEELLRLTEAGKAIGQPQRVEVEVLEGEGAVGSLEHRGAHLSSVAAGGGMILDLGIHAVAPLFALQSFLGKLPTDFKSEEVKVARCREHLALAREKFALPDANIAETYAEISATTDRGIPVKIAVGKYVLPNQNRRQITIWGASGILKMDLSDCSLSLIDSKGKKETLGSIPKKPASKYYPVMRAGLEIIAGENPFTFSANEAALAAQTWALAAREVGQKQLSASPLYAQGSDPATIFSA